MVHTPELGTSAIEGRMMNNVTVQPTWLQRIKKAQETDEELQQLKRKSQERRRGDF
jgi:hypothetical protein